MSGISIFVSFSTSATFSNITSIGALTLSFSLSTNLVSALWNQVLLFQLDHFFVFQ